MNESTGMLLTNVGLALLFGALQAAFPALTPKDLLFGVRIPKEQYGISQAKQLRRRYVGYVALLTLIFLILIGAQYVAAPGMTIILMMIFPLFFYAVWFLLYRRIWKVARELKKEMGWHVPGRVVVDTGLSAKQEKTPAGSWGWYIASAVILAAAVGYSLYLYPTLPDTLIAHWGMSGQPDRWEQKSMGSVLMLPIVTLAMDALMLVSSKVFKWTKLAANNDNPKVTLAQKRKFFALWQGYIGFITLAMTLLFCGIQLMSLNVWVPSASGMTVFMIVSTGAMIVPAIALTLYTGQSGCKLKVKEEQEPLPEYLPLPKNNTAKDDDEYWLSGLFYYNPKDPALFIEERFGVGVGLNYARLPAKIIMGATLLALVGTYVVTILALTKAL